MAQDLPIRVGEVVLCRLTHRVGIVHRIVEPDPSGRRYYVRWQGTNPDFSLMAEREILRRAPGTDPGSDSREFVLG